MNKNQFLFKLLLELFVPITAFFGTHEGFSKFIKVYCPNADEKILSALYFLPFLIAVIYLCKRPLEKEGDHIGYLEEVRRKKILAYFYTFGVLWIKDFIVGWILKSHKVKFESLSEKDVSWTNYPPEQKDYPIFRFYEDSVLTEVRFLKNKPNRIHFRIYNQGTFGTFTETNLERFGFLFVITPRAYVVQKIYG